MADVLSWASGVGDVVSGVFVFGPGAFAVFVPLFLIIALVDLSWACSSSEPRVNRYGAVPNVR